ncbi:MAG: hypothetical protein GX375_08660 [Clostridiales bacterium]|nr:hypothetical protein [Clostridiales bacterium]
MPVVSGLKKIFTKKDRFAPPNESKLNPKEKESVIVFFSLIGCIVIITAVLCIIN